MYIPHPVAGKYVLGVGFHSDILQGNGLRGSSCSKLWVLAHLAAAETALFSIYWGQRRRFSHLLSSQDGFVHDSWKLGLLVASSSFLMYF